MIKRRNLELNPKEKKRFKLYFNNCTKTLPIARLNKS